LEPVYEPYEYLWALKAVLNGRADAVIHLAASNPLRQEWLTSSRQDGKT
jgi:hypothetical protein